MSRIVLGLPFAVTEIGHTRGEPTIVLPGGPCRGPEYLCELAGLAESHRLVVLHPRGTPLSGGTSRGWWADADDVVALADQLGLIRMNILAHSAGTRLALAVAVRYPMRVRSLALVTPPASWLTGTSHDGDAIGLDRSDPDVMNALVSMERDDPSTEESFRESFLRQAPATYAHWTVLEQTHAEIGAVSLAAAQAWFMGIPIDAANQIRESDMPPTLVVGGDQDYLTGRQPVIDYASLLGADFASVADCGHYPWVEQADAFRQIVDRWLGNFQHQVTM